MPHIYEPHIYKKLQGAQLLNRTANVSTKHHLHHEHQNKLTFKIKINIFDVHEKFALKWQTLIGSQHSLSHEFPTQQKYHDHFLN